MKKYSTLFIILISLICNGQKKEKLTAQQIVDKSIKVSGGELHDAAIVSFTSRGLTYTSRVSEGKKILQRITLTASNKIVDSKENNSFKRMVDGNLVQVPDSIARAISNSVNSVHYFARLPFGLNDSAVKKELLGEKKIKDKNYYKVKVTFSEENGGEDFDDTYVYWFNTETFKPDFLAYKFHVNGGGMRFREAYNERYVGNIRFVDYKNLKPKNKQASIYTIDDLYEAGELQLLSIIELDGIKVNPN